MGSSASPLMSISGGSLRVLAALLRLPPEMTTEGAGEMPAKWLAQQKQVVEAGDLPEELLSPSSHSRGRRLSPRWKMGNGLLQTLVVTPLAPLLSGRHDNNTGDRPEGLCAAHGGLNKDLVSEVYHLVKKEVIVHGEGVRSWLRHVSRHQQEYEGQEWGLLQGFVEGMVGIVTLMEEFEVGNGKDEERWERYFGRGLGMGYMKRKGFAKVGNGCMACVLGVVGGRMGLVTGLRASCLGRARRRTPRLLGRWLPGWVEGFGVIQQMEIREKTEEIARRIRAVRGLQRERFTGGRKGQWVSSRLTRPGGSDNGRGYGGEECGEQQRENDVNEQHGSNNPYHQSASNRSPSQPEPPQPGPLGGFDGHVDDDEIYRRLMDDILPDRHHIHSPMPIPPTSPPSHHENDEKKGYVPPRQSWTAYPPPLFSSHHHHHRNQPPDLPSNRVAPGYSHDNPPRPYQAKPITPPVSSSGSYYADEIYDQYHTGKPHGKRKPGTKASTISPSRPRPEEYDGLVTVDKAASLSAQHQRRLNDCYSEKSMKSRLKRRLEGSSPRSKISSSGRTQWVDFI